MLDESTMGNDFKLCSQTILHTRNISFSFFSGLLKQVVIRYGVDIGKGEMLATESKQQGNRQLSGKVWFLGQPGELFTSS